MRLEVAQASGQTARFVDRLRVCSFATRAAMGHAAAHDIADALRTRLASQAAVRMVFAAAPSQAEMLAELVAMPGLDWSRVTAFHMDEYIGLADDAPQRFARWLEGHLFAKLPFAQVHVIQTGPDAQEAAVAYARLLDAAKIDLVCLGIGVNGHIAFNDPPVADFADPFDVKLVPLDDICRQQQVDDGCFSSINAVPTHALTLTIPRLLRADRLFCVVPGLQKRRAVEQTLYGSVSTACPSTILRQHPDCTLYLDAEADPDSRPD